VVLPTVGGQSVLQAFLYGFCGFCGFCEKKTKTIFSEGELSSVSCPLCRQNHKNHTLQAFIVPQTHALQQASMAFWTDESRFQTGSNGLQKHYENAILNNGARSKVPNDFDYGWWIIWQEQYVVSSHKVRGSRAIHSVKSG